MTYFEKIRDTVTAEVLKTWTPSLLLLLSGLLALMIPQIQSTLLSLPPSWLLGLLAISLLGNSGTTAYIFILRKQRKNLHNLPSVATKLPFAAFGVLWDYRAQPICPSCKDTPIRAEKVGTEVDAARRSLPFAKRLSLFCVKCKEIHPLSDSDGVQISPREAKKKVIKLLNSQLRK